MSHFPTLPTFNYAARPLIWLGVPCSRFESGLRLSLCWQTPSPRTTSPCVLGLPPNATCHGPFGGGPCSFDSWDEVFNLPHQGIYLVLLILELLSQLIFPGGWYCGCCHLGFCCSCLGLLSHFIFILSFSAFPKEMHIMNVRICKALLDTVQYALLAPMEQAILEESLFLQVWKFIWEPICDLGQKPLYLGGTGRDRFFLPLICMVKVLHKQVKVLDISVHDGIFFNNSVQWDISSQVSNCICSSTCQGALYAIL